MAIKYSREFKGIWIPREIWLNEKLSLTDKTLWAEINSLDGPDGCYASNEYLSKFLQISTATLKRSLKELKDAELIEESGYKGRCRVWRTRLKMSQVPGSKRADYQAQNEPQSIINEGIDEIREPARAGERLGHIFMEGMEELNGSPFGNYPKEWRATHQLVKKIEKVCNGAEPIDFMRALVKAYLFKKKTSKQEFWKEAPLTPSAINSRFDQVRECMRKHQEDMAGIKVGLKAIREHRL